jgi:hypothetical protein
LLSVLPHDRRCRLQADSDGAAFVDKGALGGNPFDDILGGPLPPLSVPRHAFASPGLSLYTTLSGKFSRVISELEIWRAANLLLKRYGNRAGQRVRLALMRLLLPAIAKVRLSGAGSRMPSRDSPTKHCPAPCIDRFFLRDNPVYLYQNRTEIQ